MGGGGKYVKLDPSISYPIREAVDVFHPSSSVDVHLVATNRRDLVIFNSSNVEESRSVVEVPHFNPTLST